jgi:hypothetical protein
MGPEIIWLDMQEAWRWQFGAQCALWRFWAGVGAVLAAEALR